MRNLRLDVNEYCNSSIRVQKIAPLSVRPSAKLHRTAPALPSIFEARPPLVLARLVLRAPSSECGYLAWVAVPRQEDKRCARRERSV